MNELEGLLSAERESTGGGTKKGEKVLDLVFREEGQNWVCRKKKCAVILFFFLNKHK